MSSRILFINFILMVIVIVETVMMVQLWVAKDNILTPEKIISRKKIGFSEKREYQAKIPPLSAYIDITQDNIFSPDRKEFIPEIIEKGPEPEPEAEPESVAEITTPELNSDRIKLFGVIVMKDVRKALVTDVDNLNEGRDSVWVKENETIDGFTVTSIKNDKIIVSSSGENFLIPLYNTKKPKQREFVTKEAKPEISVPQSQDPEVEPVPSDDEYETITTPFGTFKRKKKK